MSQVPLTSRSIPVILFILISACSDEQQRPSQPNGGASLVETAEVTREALQSNQIVTGILQAVQQVRVFNQESGRIIKLPFYPGDRVKKDDVLVEIDDRLLRSQFDKARSSLKQTQLDHKRLKSIVPRKLASEDELNRAQTNVELAQAEVTLIETQLGYTRIKAPFKGVISERHVEPGDVAPVHSHLLSIFDPDKLKIELDVSELVLNQLKTGDTVSIRIDALDDKLWPGTINRIYPAIDSSTHQGKIEVIISEAIAGARPGQLCRVQLSTQTSPRLTMPFSALRHNNQGEFVFLVNAENKITFSPVKTGLLMGERIEVLSGLQPGDQVVTKGFQGLRDGKAVNPVTKKAP
ncbi:MAG: efflux RND transporter periplasmic adaptor subunit [Gammaproteobacteria bacterium]|nr:efflux RND transporter periplasmic adaptor subunit [Gammaproteobacteria bacterium]